MGRKEGGGEMRREGRVREGEGGWKDREGGRGWRWRAFPSREAFWFFGSVTRIIGFPLDLIGFSMTVTGFLNVGPRNL